MHKGAKGVENFTPKHKTHPGIFVEGEERKSEQHERVVKGCKCKDKTIEQKTNLPKKF